jgi:serine protease Do
MRIGTAFASWRPAAIGRAFFALLALLALSGSLALEPPPAHAAARMPPAEGFADLVERLTPAVVNIASTIRGGAGLGERERSELKDIPPGQQRDEFFDFFGQNGEGDGDGEGDSFPAASLGSGFIIDPAGYVVTNNHVIADADDISVVLDNGNRLKASVVGRDAKTDLALLKVEAGRPLPHVLFGDSDRARVGDWVIAIGNPFGLGNSVSAGILSARGRDINAGPYDDFLQTDAPINRGNSGGPMFDLDGSVIGVNTLIYSPSGGSVGIGFATPASIARPVIDQLKHFGSTRRGWIGVRVQSVSEELAARLGLPSPSGALVAGVIARGPAEAAGIRSGDVILRFDGRVIAGRRTLPRVVADTEVGRPVEVVIWRDRKETTVRVSLGHLEEYEKKEEAALAERLARMRADAGAEEYEKKEEAALAPPKPAPAPEPSRAPAKRGHGAPEAFAALGATLAELDAATRTRYGFSADEHGVVVTAADASSELAPGDLVLELDRHRIERLIDVKDALAERRADDRTPLIVLRQRNREREFVIVPPPDWNPQG